MKKTTEQYITSTIKDQTDYYLMDGMHKIKLVLISDKKVEFEVFVRIKKAPKKSKLDAMKLTFGEILGTSGRVNQEVMKKKLSEYLKYGVTDSSAVAGELEMVMKDLASAPGKRFQSTDQLFEYLMRNPIFRKATELRNRNDIVDLKTKPCSRRMIRMPASAKHKTISNLADGFLIKR